MGIEFAERILDGMVDENGHCGERGMSNKQFDCIARYLEGGKVRDAGCWEGDFKVIGFTSQDFEGNVGKYHVVLNEYWHFNRACSVVSIDLRPKAEIEFEAKMRELAKFENSEWVAEPKKRIDLELTLVRDYQYERKEYGSWSRYETAHVYTLADSEGNCFVWKTAKLIEQETELEDGEIVSTCAEVGDKVTMRATVKEHSEYRGVKQTVITRPKVEEVEKRAA